MHVARPVRARSVADHAKPRGEDDRECRENSSVLDPLFIPADAVGAGSLRRDRAASCGRAGDAVATDHRPARDFDVDQLAGCPNLPWRVPHLAPGCRGGALGQPDPGGGPSHPKRRGDETANRAVPHAAHAGSAGLPVAPRQAKPRRRAAHVHDAAGLPGPGQTRAPCRAGRAGGGAGRQRDRHARGRCCRRRQAGVRRSLGVTAVPRTARRRRAARAAAGRGRTGEVRDRAHHAARRRQGPARTDTARAGDS